MLLIGAIIVLVIGGIFAFRYFASYESTDDAEVDGHLMPLSARDFRLRLQGQRGRQPGREGRRPSSSKSIPKDYQVAVDQGPSRSRRRRSQRAGAEHQRARSRLSTPRSEFPSSQAEVEDAQAGITAAQQQSDAAQAQLTQAQANNVKAQNDLVRYKQLVDKQEISQQQYDQAVAAAKASAAAVAAAQVVVRRCGAAGEPGQSQSSRRRRPNFASSQTGPSRWLPRAPRSFRRRVGQQKQAALEQAQLNFSYTKIVAPVDGVVTKNVEVGMNVQPGQQLLTIVPAQRRLGHRQFQGDAAQIYAPGPARRN